MYLLYVDESGDVANVDESYFVLGAVAVFERQEYFLSQNLDELQRLHFLQEESPLWLHASDIRARKKPPWQQMVREEAQSLLDGIARVIQEAHDPGLRLFAVAVHRPSYPTQNVVEIAFEELCNRFDLFLKRLYQEGNVQRGLIIMDRSRYQSRLEMLMKQLRETGGRFGRTRNLVDIPLFTNSRLTRMLQLADFTAWSVFQRYERNSTEYLDKIVKRFDEADNVLHGLVHLVKDWRNCYCPACLSRRNSP